MHDPHLEYCSTAPNAHSVTIKQTAAIVIVKGMWALQASHFPPWKDFLQGTPFEKRNWEMFRMRMKSEVEYKPKELRAEMLLKTAKSLRDSGVFMFEVLKTTAILTSFLATSFSKHIRYALDVKRNGNVVSWRDRVMKKGATVQLHVAKEGGIVAL